ncbi:hypothetical protein BpHYR1_046360 [Brachionus plicatilis]|uniref:Uncharacterized protein n=1 Tax=Brachionus plicatilis TaxID=10195 RepID=A0A3M7RG91_BRAPC|nr:hypothetical protein BpHYR1_046360 [Brachionus plicatilis]
MIMKNRNLKWDDIKAHFKSSNELIQLSRTHESDKVRLPIRAVPKRIGEELMLRQIERLDEALNVVKLHGEYILQHR